MKIMILTQEENVYLPAAFSKVCGSLGSDIESVVILPAMSTHGGPLKGFIRIARLFGVIGVINMAARVFSARVKNLVMRPGEDGPFHSIISVTKAHGITTRKFTNLKSPQFKSMLDNSEADLLISISCPQIVGKSIRESFSMGAINVHSSPLPKYRGLMPAFWILKNNEPETAVTVHDLGAKLDDGDILLQQSVTITPDETWDSLVRKTKSIGADLLVDAVRQIEQGTISRQPNREDEGSYFGFPTAQDSKVFKAHGRRFF